MMPSTEKAPARIPSLDGLRALSFLIVFVSHAGLAFIPGGFGVTIFFFLSGFIITTLLRAEFDATAQVHFGNFYLRRVLRILPPLYLVLAGATLITLIIPIDGPMSVSGILAQALQWGNYWTISHRGAEMPRGLGVYWSLAVEEHFYLVFPLLYFYLRRTNRAALTQARIFWGLCALVLVWRCVLILLWHADPDRTYFATDTRIDSILYGCALAVWCNPAVDRFEINERLWKFLITPLALAALLGCMLVRGDAFRETFRYSIQGIALSFIFIAAIRFAHWLPFRFLNTRLMIWGGTLSYSLYLLHLVILLNVQQVVQWSQAWQAAFSLGAAVLIAWLMYIGVERPCARLRQRLLSRSLEPARTAGERPGRPAVQV